MDSVKPGDEYIVYIREDLECEDRGKVVRCKDCVNCRKSTLAGRSWKHCAFIGNVVYDDNYCCWAERKEG